MCIPSANWPQKMQRQPDASLYILRIFQCVQHSMCILSVNQPKMQRRPYTCLYILNMCQLARNARTTLLVSRYSYDVSMCLAFHVHGGIAVLFRGLMWESMCSLVLPPLWSESVCYAVCSIVPQYLCSLGYCPAMHSRMSSLFSASIFVLCNERAACGHGIQRKDTRTQDFDCRFFSSIGVPLSLIMGLKSFWIPMNIHEQIRRHRWSK